MFDSRDLYQLAHEAASDDNNHVAANWLNRKASLKRSDEENTKSIRVWCIGSDGTEIFAAYSEQEMKDYYRKLCADKNEAEDDLRNYFEEITDIDAKFKFKDADGDTVMTSWREIADDDDLPSQIGTGYN